MAQLSRRSILRRGSWLISATAIAAACAPAVSLTATPDKPIQAAPTTAAVPAATKPAAAVAAISKLNVALVPSENAQEQARQYGEFFKWIGKKLDLTVNPFIATDYSGVIEAMRAKHVDVAWYGPFSYILAAQEAGAEAVALPIGEKTGKTYFSYFIARSDSGIEKLQDMKGKTFSFGDPASTSGHLIPRYTLKKAGIEADKDFKSVVFSGAHDATGLAVANGKVDAGAIWDAAYHRLAEKKLLDESKMKIVQKSDPIPEGPWSIRKDIDPGFKQRFADALMAVGGEAPETIKSGGYVKFVPVPDSDYDVIRETAKALNLDVKKLK